MRKLLLFAALTLAGTGFPACAGAAGPQPQPVRVQFDELLWVYSADGLPSVRQGRVVVPLRPLCDLFGAKCVVDWARRTVQVNQAGRLSVAPLAGVRGQGRARIGLVELQGMAGPLGYAVTWDGAAGRAKVQRVVRMPGGLSAIQGNVAGRERTAPSPKVPVWVQVTDDPGLKSFKRLSLSSDQVQFNRSWIYFKSATGSPGLGGELGCRGRRPAVCTAVIDPDNLFVLVQANATP